MKNISSKFIFLFLLIIISIVVTGCTIEKSYPIRTNDINEDKINTETENSIEETQDSSDETSSEQVVTNTNLPDVVLKDLKIYDQSLKQYISLSDAITASDPIELTIVVKNQGKAPYVDSKGNSPIIITMITEAYPSNLYLYSNNYTALNPGDERVYKSNVIKFRTLGTFETRIFPSIQYITAQPEEVNIENNEMNIDLTVKAK